jgi:hypothetical protein
VSNFEQPTRMFNGPFAGQTLTGCDANPRFMLKRLFPSFADRRLTSFGINGSHDLGQVDPFNECLRIKHDISA